tara:strand:+ start:141 stop:617 length:477 start_codon:yes stop_codon:yes gene_type:complete
LDLGYQFQIKVKAEPMNRLIISIILLFIFSCSSINKIDERSMLEQKIAAFQFLSGYHHQLHVMIGEEKGNIDKAYNEFLAALVDIKNPELIPVKKALMRVKELDAEAIPIKRLDYLVDYYQSGLSMQIEGIMRGYGYLETFAIEEALPLYDRLEKNKL